MALPNLYTKEEDGDVVMSDSSAICQKVWPSPDVVVFTPVYYKSGFLGLPKRMNFHSVGDFRDLQTNYMYKFYAQIFSYAIDMEKGRYKNSREREERAKERKGFGEKLKSLEYFSKTLADGLRSLEEEKIAQENQTANRPIKRYVIATKLPEIFREGLESFRKHHLSNRIFDEYRYLEDEFGDETAKKIVDDIHIQIKTPTELNRPDLG